MCKDCGRQFIENPPNKRIPQQLWDMADKLLLEKIPIAGISRVTEISEPWLQQYINQKYEHVPKQIDISKKGGTVDLPDPANHNAPSTSKPWMIPSIRAVPAHSGIPACARLPALAQIEITANPMPGDGPRSPQEPFYGLFQDHPRQNAFWPGTPFPSPRSR